MIITEDFARKAILEVAPLVEDIGKLKTELDNYEIHVKNIPSQASYLPPFKLFSFNNALSGNKVYLKSVISHELFHNAQFSTIKDLWKRHLNINQISSKQLENRSSLTKLIEGDATFVEMEVEKVLQNNILARQFDRLKFPKYYKSWENILRKKFSGKRKDINELYTAPIEELNKIFKSD